VAETADLTNPAVIKDLLARHDFRVSNRLGQNFLRNRSILDSVVEAAEVEGEAVIEIGPGLGVLTQPLAERADRLVAVEAARRLEPILAETLHGLENVTLFFEDFLRLPAERLGKKPLVMASNLPYSITTPALFRFLDGEIPWKRIVVMVQFELAVRLTAAPGNHDYGALSVAAQSAGRPRIVRRVPSGAFWPPPRVASAIVRIDPRPDFVAPAVLRPLLRRAFSSRRKTLKNALGGLPEVLDRARSLGIDLGRRPETLSVDEWRALAATAP
jgi:16S rRNA (adenine1518-N6/adenine1519-N6)-dimethyltransferase